MELHHHEEPRSDRTADDSGDAAPQAAGRSTELYKEVHIFGVKQKMASKS